MFPWSNQKVIQTQKAETLSENILIIKSSFQNIHNGPVLSMIDKSYYCSIDYCSFLDCSCEELSASMGCVHLILNDFGSVSISRTIAGSCMSSKEGNFARIEVKQFGSIFVLMTSIDKCAPNSIRDTYHSMVLSNGAQVVSNLNNTRCFAERHSGISNINTQSGQVNFCNFANNIMTMSCLHSLSGNTEVRRVNYIHNILGTLFPNHEGLIITTPDLLPSRIILSDCFLANNTAECIISVNKADITLVGCNLDSDKFIFHDANVNIEAPQTRSVVTMTLMAGAGKNADIPYGKMMTVTGKNCLLATILFLFMILTN